MFALEVVVGAAILAGIAFVASHEVAGLEDDEDAPDIGLPDDRPVRSDDLDALRLRVVGGWWGAIRGYRFADVDRAIDTVRRTLQGHEAQRCDAAAVEAGPASAPPPPWPAVTPPPESPAAAAPDAGPPPTR